MLASWPKVHLFFFLFFSLVAKNVMKLFGFVAPNLQSTNFVGWCAEDKKCIIGGSQFGNYGM